MKRHLSVTNKTKEIRKRVNNVAFKQNKLGKCRIFKIIDNGNIHGKNMDNKADCGCTDLPWNVPLH